LPCHETICLVVPCPQIKNLWKRSVANSVPNNRTIDENGSRRHKLKFYEIETHP
jgi:hypothetical protein